MLTTKTAKTEGSWSIEPEDARCGGDKQGAKPAVDVAADGSAHTAGLFRQTHKPGAHTHAGTQRQGLHVS